ncbi:MAG: hypothetical protein KC900_07325 [Candidatus Omnitrophica bacterium]|nr:hypothetical protein [Candidatus Omnitrophota bacterium]
MRVDYVLNELKSFGQAMCREDRCVYERMLKEPLKHVGAVSYASSLDVWAFVLLSILLEQEKRIRKLEERFDFAHRPEKSSGTVPSAVEGSRPCRPG